MHRPLAAGRLWKYGPRRRTKTKAAALSKMPHRGAALPAGESASLPYFLLSTWGNCHHAAPNIVPSIAHTRRGSAAGRSSICRSPRHSGGRSVKEPKGRSSRRAITSQQKRTGVSSTAGRCKMPASRPDRCCTCLCRQRDRRTAEHPHAASLQRGGERAPAQNRRKVPPPARRPPAPHPSAAPLSAARRAPSGLTAPLQAPAGCARSRAAPDRAW